jgi:predicted RNase H-like HicB family nuclease
MNTVPIVIEKQSGDRFTATIWGLPDCHASGGTREEALDAVQDLLAGRLQQAEVVLCQIPNLQEEHPLVKLAGKFKDDPYFDEMLASIATYRQELDAESNISGLEQSVL